MHVAVLGTLEVTARALPVHIAGPQPRRLLALLAAQPGREVSVDQIVEGLWDAPPAAAATTVQSHVARLRRMLPDPQVVATGRTGYRLEVAHGDVDAGAFAACAVTGRAALQTGDLERAAALLETGLALWRGPAYAEFPDCEPLVREAGRLELLRLDALQWRITADLARPGGHAPVAELEDLVRDHPTRETLWALLMRALYRAGRQAEALQAYQRARRTLVAELGIEPGPELRDTERQVLEQDSALGRPERAVPAGAGTDRWMATPERRTVSVMAVELPGTPDGLDPEDVEAWLEPQRAVVRALAEALGGRVRAEIGGSCVVLFGAPVAYEDDATRAVRTAVAVVGGLRDVLAGDRAARVGICTGEALVGGRGDAAGVAGPPLGRALALRDAARAGEVAVDASTRRRTAEHVEYDDRGEAAATVTRLRDVAGVLCRPSATPLVGRGDNLDALRASYTRAVADRAPQLVTVVAEPGIGKTRLVAELGASLRHEGAPALWRQGRCLPYGDDIAFLALTDVVKSHAGITDTDPVDEAVRKLREALPADECDEILDRLAPLLGGDSGVTPDRAESFAAWRRFVEVMAGRSPLVLLVEDLHWASPGLLDFLEHLLVCATDVALLVVVTARPELFDVRPSWGGGPHGSSTLRLSRLTDSETAQLLDHLLGDAANDQRALLIERCAGIPLFAEELARWAAHLPPAGGAVPEALSTLIAARLDTVSPGQQRVLQRAAVAGKTFWHSQVCALGDDTDGDVDQALRVLIQREFIRRAPSSRPGDAEYVFSHDLARDAVYGRLTRLDRARLHLGVVTWWESAAPDRLDEFADILAHHAGTAYELACTAGDTAFAEQARGPACRAAAVAGERLQGIDTPAAMRLLRSALDLAEDGSPLQARILTWYGAVLFDDRQFENAIAALERALPTLERANDPLCVDLAFFLLNAQFSLGIDLDSAIAALARAVDVLPAGLPVVRSLSMLAMAQMVAQTQDSLRAAIATADRAISMAFDTGVRQTGLAHVVRGRARLGLGDERGMAELENALPDLTRYESGTLAIGARQWLAGALHHWRGPAAEWAARQELEALAAARGLQFVTSMGVAEDVRVLCELGRLRDAIGLADSVELGSDAMPRWAVVQRALALLDLGELDDATLARAVDTPPADPGDLRHVLGAVLVQAGAALEAGKPKEVGPLLIGLGDLQQYVERDGAVELLPRLVRIATAAGFGHLVSGLTGLDLGATPLRRHLGAHLDGLLARLLGNHDRAAGRLAQAVHGWQDFGARYEAAFAQDDLARSLAALGAASAATVEAAAHSELAAMGMAVDPT